MKRKGYHIVDGIIYTWMGFVDREGMHFGITQATPCSTTSGIHSVITPG